ncbi:hypothetical protein MTO96_044003 [Rhipicephalus appendiculatus]
MCGDVFYKLCHPNRDQPEFHYRRSVNACVETATDTVHSCNRGVNRFASIALCRRSCMHPGHRPAEECYGKPLFTSCSRRDRCHALRHLGVLCRVMCARALFIAAGEDVLSSWWFFEGRKCVPWNFPSGGCPADDSAVFRTAQECRTQCLGSSSAFPVRCTSGCSLRSTPPKVSVLCRFGHNGWPHAVPALIAYCAARPPVPDRR